MKMLRMFATGLGLMGAAALSSVPASAQTNWSGLYGGSHTGFGWTGMDYTTGFAATAAGPFNNADNFNHAASGLIGGGQVGLQHQWNHLVAGIEVSLSGAVMSDKQDTPKFPGYIHEAELRYTGAITGKLGYAWSNWLAYVKAGYAFGSIDMDYNKAGAAGFVTAANRVNVDGWILGVGAELMWKPGISMGIEYNYQAMSGDARPFLLTNGNFQNQSGFDMDVHSVMLRTNFHLHRPAPAAEPMK